MTVRIEEPRFRRSLSLLVVPAVLTSLAGCAPDPADDWSTGYELSWSAAATLLSDPVVAGDVVLAYVASGDAGEAVVAWDLDHGEELWRRQSLPGRDAPGVAHQIAALQTGDGWQVSLLVPDTPGAPLDYWSFPEVLDVRTGESLVDDALQTGVWSTRPEVCGEKDERFCILGIVEPNTDDPLDAVRTYGALDRGLHIADTSEDGYFESGIQLSSRLSVNAQDDLTYGEGGARIWSRPYVDVFGEGSSIGGGWSFSDGETDEPLLAIGYTYVDRQLSDAPEHLENELGSGRAVRLDRETGETIWSVDAETCDFTSSWMQVTDDMVILCRYEGSVTAEWTGTEADDIRYHDAAVEAMGIDLETGDTVWTAPLGDAGMSEADADVPGTKQFLVDDKHLIAEVDGHVTIIDNETGASERLQTGARVLCAFPQERIALESIWKHASFAPAEAYELCGPDGTPEADAQIPRAALVIAGYDLDQPIVINTPEGLRRYVAADD